MFVESGLIIIGILGLAIRRNLIAIGFSFILLFAGILLWLESLTPRSEIATVLTLVFILQILLYGVLSILPV